LGVNELVGIPQQAELAPLESEPVELSRADILDRTAGPVPRHFAWRQLPAGRLLGERGGVDAFVFRGAAAGTQRHVRAVRLRIVANEEIRSRLRRREMEFAADD